MHHALLASTARAPLTTRAPVTTSLTLNLRFFKVALQCNLILSSVCVHCLAHGRLHVLQSHVVTGIGVAKVVVTGWLSQDRMSLNAELGSIVIDQRIQVAVRAWRHHSKVTTTWLHRQFLLVGHPLAADVEVGHLTVHTWTASQVLTSCCAEVCAASVWIRRVVRASLRYVGVRLVVNDSHGGSDCHLRLVHHL